MLLVVAVGGLVVAASSLFAFRRGGGGSGGGAVDESGLRAVLAREVGLKGAGVQLDIGPPVPGVLVFHAVTPGSATPGVTGVYDGRLHTEPQEATRVVLTALRFGEAEVDPVVVAGAVGKLEGNPGTPFLTQFAIDQSGDPSVMFLPRTVEVDGAPAVEYVNMTSRRTPWRSLVLRRADGTFEVRQGPLRGGG